MGSAAMLTAYLYYSSRPKGCLRSTETRYCALTSSSLSHFPLHVLIHHFALNH